jgi:fibro-slime domain-containing protein
MLLNTKNLLRTTLILPAVAFACSAGDPAPDGGTTDGSTDGSGAGLSVDGSLDGVGGNGGGIDQDIIDAPPTASCADGKLDDDEACDDRNMVSGDGCGSNCRYVEPGWVCPDAGEPCRAFAKCGDAGVVFPEQCDDGGLTPGDGCSATCKFEVGYTCNGSPSTCTPTVCGDGTQEGAETCDVMGNTEPFDGCSATCQGEPTCTDMGCTSSCGDGLIIGAEQCDDGNGIKGDGCSETCQQEPGYVCSQAPPCEGEACTLNLPIVFRDFNESHPDFWPPYKAGDMDGHAPGIVTDRLDANGKPVYASSPTLSHVTSAETFNEWYNTTAANSLIVGNIMLYANGEGGFVNRFGANGEKYIAAVKTPNEQQGGATLAACETTCEQRAMDAQPPFFEGLDPLRCTDLCRPLADEAQQLTSNQLNQANIQLDQAMDADPQDEELIAALEAEIADIEAEIEMIQGEHATCLTDCETELAARTAICAATCAPCSDNSGMFCFGGETLELDGNPLFFPIDEPTPGILEDTRGAAKIPAQVYQGIGWPWEAGGTEATPPAGSPMHNFHFTSEIAYWFKYTEGMVASFSFIGDDDVFVYVNRRLLIDLGGIHVPLTGEFSFAANGSVAWATSEPPDAGDEGTPGGPLDSGTTSVADLGLEDGGVYEIKVFHAERKPEGSSFQLTLSGFNAARSECVPVCGDGIIAAGEQCDDGEAENTGGHNRCNANCTIGEYCGDGVVQPEVEACDDADPLAMANCAGCRILVVK